MSAPATIERVGRENQPVVVLDGFAADPDGLRDAAAQTVFGPASNHYPGVRAALPPGYLEPQVAVLRGWLGSVYGRSGAIAVIDASFSIVTTAPERLSIPQRLPHCDSFGADRFALVHYLSLAGSDGTAFYRHRATGFETLDAERAAIFFGQVDAELRHGNLPAPGYVNGDTPLFERTGLIGGQYNRAVLYPSYLLHSGAIAPDANLSSDPRTGRLTVTASFSVA